MTKFAIVFCILLAASVAYSMKVSSPLPGNLTWSKFNTPAICLTEELLNKQIDVMLNVQNERAVIDYYNETDRMLNNAWSIWSGIHNIIQEKKTLFNATFGTNDEINDISRRIFWNWVQTGRELANGYMNSIRHGYSIMKESSENIRNTESIFDVLRTYKAEINKCFKKSLSWITSMRCKKQLADKIRNAIHTVRLYVLSLIRLKTLRDEINEGKKYLNIEKHIPRELLDFYMGGIDIVDKAKSAIDYVVQ